MHCFSNAFCHLFTLPYEMMWAAAFWFQWGKHTSYDLHKPYQITSLILSRVRGLTLLLAHQSFSNYQRQ